MGTKLKLISKAPDIRVYPLKQRRSLLELKKIVVEPSAEPPPIPSDVLQQIDECAERIIAARRKGSTVLLIYGAHLIKNGGQLIVNQLLDHQWVTHLATNGAGMIHDWEFSFLGRSTESVRQNVAEGCFGTWNETGLYLTLATLIGCINGEGIGKAVGRLIQQDGLTIPDPSLLHKQVALFPNHELTPVRSELLRLVNLLNLKPGTMLLLHPYRNASVIAHAFRRNVPLTVHPGIGYDIIITHPLYSGVGFGRGAQLDFYTLVNSVAKLENGVVLNVGTAVMGPQVFEKSISCVNNLRLQQGLGPLQGHSIYVVDIQDAGGWNWEQGEPSQDNPAYYLRFCKSFSRMGGQMRYVQCHNIAFLHNLFHKLCEKSGRPIRKPLSQKEDQKLHEERS